MVNLRYLTKKKLFLWLVRTNFAIDSKRLKHFAMWVKNNHKPSPMTQHKTIAAMFTISHGWFIVSPCFTPMKIHEVSNT